MSIRRQKFSCRLCLWTWCCFGIYSRMSHLQSATQVSVSRRQISLSHGPSLDFPPKTHLAVNSSSTYLEREERKSWFNWIISYRLIPISFNDHSDFVIKGRSSLSQRQVCHSPRVKQLLWLSPDDCNWATRVITVIKFNLNAALKYFYCIPLNRRASNCSLRTRGRSHVSEPNANLINLFPKGRIQWVATPFIILITFCTERDESF